MIRVKNPPELDVPMILDQMKEPRPLPMGDLEFEEWSDRIISGALITGEKGKEDLLVEGQKFALANMLMHLGPTEDHKPDSYFIHQLRKVVVNQVAHSKIQEIKKAQLERAKAAGEESNG